MISCAYYHNILTKEKVHHRYSIMQIKQIKISAPKDLGFKDLIQQNSYAYA